MQEIDLTQPALETKCAAARELLEKLLHKLSRIIDEAVFKEFSRIDANLEASFILQRSAKHLTKLAYSIHFIRRKLSRNKSLFPFNEHFDVRIFPSTLHFTFGTKSVLSVLTHAHLKDKYETFDEELILFIIRKLIPDADVNKDSIYAFQPTRSTIKTLYFEIHKKSGQLFSTEEIKQLKTLLRSEIKFSIEQLIPRIFMVRNEEEVLKNILTLSREIHFITDLPQVMILFDQQTAHEATFTIILVKVLKAGDVSMQQRFKQLGATYVHERCQIVCYLRKKYPIETNVFRIKLPKDPSILRVDRSLNFYLGRQKISQLLMDAVGEFRDYNGGIILKQRETLTAFRTAFQDVSLEDPDLLETFYYSLSPIEAQATLTLEPLKIFFSLFLEAKCASFSKPHDVFLKFHTILKHFFVLIRTPDPNLKEKIDAIFSHLFSVSKIVSFNILLRNTHFLGYLLEDIEEKTERELRQSINQTLTLWQHKIQTRQVLKLCIEYPIVSLDPRIGGDQVSAFILKMLFEGLMRMNRQGKLENGIAKEVEISPDQKTYLFRLRSTVWSDRSEVTAYDFEYTWKKVLSPSFYTSFAYLFYPIKNAKHAKQGEVEIDAIGVKALDAHTLKVELEFPSPYFLELTAHTIYSPIPRLIDQIHPNWPAEEKSGYICNGAFQLKKNYGEGYDLFKNPLYWDAAHIKLDEINIIKTNRQHSYEMFHKNLNHWFGTPTTKWNPGFPSNATDELITFENRTVYWLAFNTQCFPFTHKKIRQALSLGINRSKLTSLFDLLPAFFPFPPTYSHLKNSMLTSYEQARAQNLFKEALQEVHLSLKEFPEIPLIYLEGGERDQIAKFIKEEWEMTFGIKCTLHPLEWKVLFSKITQGDFHIGGIAWELWIKDPLYTLNIFRDAKEKLNFPKWQNVPYEKLMHNAEREIDLKKRHSYYLQAEQLLLEEMPITPLFYPELRALKKKNFYLNHSSSLIDLKWGYFT